MIGCNLTESDRDRGSQTLNDIDPRASLADVLARIAGMPSHGTNLPYAPAVVQRIDGEGRQ